jgi:ubiquinone/menaquinone biosynthesis C-methylase UbiE
MPGAVKMTEQMLYKDLAKYYDYIYSNKDYAGETTSIKKLIVQFKMNSGNTLLDVACGTGHHIEHLQDEYTCTGVDVNDEMLEQARINVPGIQFLRANMITMNLGQTFDVITCLFSSIGYVKTLTNLKKTLSNFYRHLNEGGVAIIEPWFISEVYSVGSPHMETYSDADLKIARLNVSQRKDDVSVLKMHYLIAERDGEVKHYIDRHELGLFEIKDTLEIIRSVGFQAEYLRDGLLKERGLYICKKII